MPPPADLRDSPGQPQEYRNVGIDQGRQNPPDSGHPNMDGNSESHGNGRKNGGTDPLQANTLESLSAKVKAQWNNRDSKMDWKSFTNQLRFANLFSSMQNSSLRGRLNTASKLKPFKAF